MRIMLRVFIWTLLAVGGAARGGGWTAELPGGLRLAIVQDAARAREGYLLERRYPDGRLDAQFGDGGSVLFSLGPDNAGPAALRLDARGRAWIAGAGQAADGRLQAVLLRFGPDGRPDGGFGSQGRSATAPAGREARATDVLPLDDGSAWVAGLVIDAQGGERAGVWRVQADGRIDPRFGLGGLWADEGPGEADVGGLERAPDGELALGLRRVDGGRATLETWTWRPGQQPQRRSAESVDTRQLDSARLAWHDGQWRWSGSRGRVPPAPAALEQPASRPAPSPPAAAAIAPPFAATATPAAASAAHSSGADTSAGWWLLVPAGAALAWWWQQRRRLPFNRGG